MLAIEIVRKINKDVYRRFPEMTGKSPRIQLQPTRPATPATGLTTFLLTYSTRVTTATNQILARSVRVVVTEQGKILKMTTSR